MKKSEKILPVILMVWPYVFSIFLFLPDKTGEAHINFLIAYIKNKNQIKIRIKFSRSTSNNIKEESPDCVAPRFGDFVLCSHGTFSSLFI